MPIKEAASLMVQFDSELLRRFYSPLVESWSPFTCGTFFTLSGRILTYFLPAAQADWEKVIFRAFLLSVLILLP